METNLIKELRINKKLSQEDAAKLCGLSTRTFQNYEYGRSSRDKIKINYIIETLSKYEKYGIDKGILCIDEISSIVAKVFSSYEVKYAYLFGSYAKSKARENSDVDLLIGGKIKGLDFVSLHNDLFVALKKNVDLIRIDDLKNNQLFLDDILLTGVKIYGGKS